MMILAVIDFSLVSVNVLMGNENVDRNYESWLESDHRVGQNSMMSTFLELEVDNIWKYKERYDSDPLLLNWKHAGCTGA